MARLCGQCGYDVTSVPVQPGGRLCPECGRLGRGTRAWRGVVWAAWRASRGFVGWIVVAAGCLLFGLGEVRGAGKALEWVAVAMVVAGVGVLHGLIKLFAVPQRYGEVQVADVWGRRSARFVR